MFWKRLMPAMGLLALCVTCNTGFAQEPCPTTTWTLWAGQTNDVGSVSVTNDSTNLYVTYTLDYQDPTCLVDTDGDGMPDTESEAVEAEFGTLHLWVGDTDPTGPLSTMPATGQGTPIPGQFPYHFDANGLQTHTFTIPLAELAIKGVDVACDAKLYVVAHAEVNYLDCDGEPNDEGDTAFGGDKPGIGPRWWYYGEYTVCCDGTTEVPFCQTAYAKGGHVWTTDKRSNPQNLPSLKLTKNRWGWAINLTATGETTYEIWAGAGLNDTTKGTLVGTLTVDWDGTNVSFCYDLNDGYTMEELHFYAGDDSPTTIAPGQYGYIQDFNDAPQASWCDTLPLADANGGGVWVVAHAVVCDGD